MTVRIRSLPLPILTLAALFFLLPPAAYVVIGLSLELPLLDPAPILERFHLFHLLLSVCSLAIGVGLLRVEKWAYYLFLVFVALLLGFNLYRAVLLGSGGGVASPSGRSLTLPGLGGGTIVILLLAGVLLYFLRKEISAPYLSVAPRGFRRFMRETLPMPLRWETVRGGGQIAGETVSENISVTGCLIPLPAATPLVPGDRLMLQLVLHYDHAPTLIDVQGEVIRVLPPPADDPDEPGAAGIRFYFGPDAKAEQDRLRRFLTERFAPRYRATNALRWRFMDGDEAGQETSGGLFNISARGAYVHSERLPPHERDIRLEIDSPQLTGTGRVRWTNPAGQWGKPKGFGVEFDTLRPRLSFWLYLLGLRWRSFRIR